MADHAAALPLAKVIAENIGTYPAHYRNLAAAYLELRELAKAVLDERVFARSDKEVLRAALGEE